MVTSHPHDLHDLFLTHESRFDAIETIDFDTEIKTVRTVEASGLRSVERARCLGVVHPLRGNPAAALFRFVGEPAGLLVLAEGLAESERVATAWCDAPHPLVELTDLMVVLVDDDAGSDAICEEVRRVISAQVASVEETLANATPAPSGERSHGVVLRGGSYALASELRRVALRDLEAWATSRATIRVNTSTLSDEALVDRLSLLPIRVDEGAMAGASTAVASLSLRNDDPIRRRVVYGGDVRVSEACTIVDPAVPVVVLTPGQEVQIELELDRRAAGCHGRYSSVVEAAYVERAVLAVDDGEWRALAADTDSVTNFVRRLGGGFELDAAGALAHRANASSDPLGLSMKRASFVEAIDREFRRDEAVPIVRLTADERTIHLFLETDGRIDAPRALASAVSTLVASMRELEALWATRAFERVESEHVDFTNPSHTPPGTADDADAVARRVAMDME